MKIIYEDNHILVVLKPVNMLVQGDSTGDWTMEEELKKYLKEKYNKPGNVYLGVVHRLDRTVGGIMVFARTSKAASRLSEQIRSHQMKKEYHAVVHGRFDHESGVLIDKLWKDESKNIVTVNEKGKEAILNYRVLDYQENLSLISINLETGRSHQIRVQFSSRNHAIYGDGKYSKKDLEKTPICLFASSLTFYHPVTKEEMNFTLLLPNYYPWDIFKDENKTEKS